MNSFSDQSPAPRAQSPADAKRPWRFRRPLKWLLVTVGTLAILVAAVLGAFGIVVGRVPEYRVQVQDWLSDRTGLVVEFHALSARFRLFGPELVFEDAVVRTPDRTRVLAAAKRGSVGFDIWNSLRNGQLSAGRFWLHSPQISLLRTREGRIQLLGQSALAERADAKPIAIEHLPTGRFEVTDAVVHFRDEFTGRGPWSVSGVSFDLTRDVDSIHLTGEASLPAVLGQTLSFAASAEGGLQDPRAVESRFTIASEVLDLSGWADVFPDEWPAPETGRGSVKLEGALRGPELIQLSAAIDFARISTALPMWSTPLPGPAPMEPKPTDDSEEDAAAPAPVKAEPADGPMPTMEMVSYERIALRADARRSGDEWTAVISDLDISRTGMPWQAKHLEARWSQTDEASTLHMKADRLELGNLWPLLAYFPESDELARLRALRASGSVENLSLQFERAVPDATPTYAVEAALRNIAFQPVDTAPGMSGVSGQLRADQDHGKLQLNAREVRYELPRMFRDVLEADAVEGLIDWQLDGSGVTVRSSALRLRGEGGSASAQVQVFVPRDGSSTIVDLSAHGENLEVASAGRYVPGHKLQAKTLEWFDRAFVAGRIRAADFDMQGPIRSFPFRNDEGTFKASAQIEGATFAYHDAWAPATDIDARVEFRNEGMSVEATSLQVGALRSSEAKAEIADLKDAELQIEAVSSGDLHDALQFLKDSPIGPAIGPQLGDVDGQGALSADLKLLLPIKRMADREIEITARVEDGTVTHRHIDAPVRGLHGTLTVQNTLISAADLNGSWLNGPLQIDVSPRGRTRSALSASGRATAAQLKPLLALPDSITISGATDWRVTTSFLAGESAGTQEQRVQLVADLRDFGFELPRPVGKLEGEERTLKLDVAFERRDRVLARATLGDIRALLRVQQSSGKWKLERGGLRADGIAPSLPSHRGLRIEGAIERFALDEWLSLRGPPGQGKALSDYLQAANVRIGMFELYGYQWSDLRGILQATPSGWRVDVSGPEAVGQVIIPQSFTGTAPIRAALERLVLTKSKRERTERDEAPIDPRALPTLDVHIADLHLGERRIGAVDLQASRAPTGLRFDRMDISGTSVQAEGRGEWLASAQGSRSSLTATVTSSDVAATLTALDYTPFLQAERGEIRANLSWPGGYDANILEEASGEISVRADAGQIVNLQPGAGRMLGLFSVAALPRRLALDFSDLTEKGLSFDSIEGDFELRAGNAYTSNLLLRGPAAEIGIAGRTGFGTRDYDQTAIVTGNLGASLPVAGALAGGPAVGAALLLFSQVFKEPLKGMTRGYYRITGPWENPNVERIEASAVKDATARALYP